MQLAATLHPVAFIGFIFVLGLVVGSFLNVVIYRLPKMIETGFRYECAYMDDENTPAPPRFNLAKPDSTCPCCGTLIRGYDNIPVLSWVILGGKCRACKAPISIRYPAIECMTGVLSALIAWRYGFSAQTLGGLLLMWPLMALFWIDADTQLLPDDITLPLVWLGLIFNINGTFTSLTHAVIGAIAGYMTLWTVYWVHHLLTGREGMGYGDFKLLAAIGAWFGWMALPQVILLSSVTGAILGIILMLGEKLGWQTRLPFGPYLALAAICTLFEPHLPLIPSAYA
ncbi:A24 family peptidase [Burkholderiaceae bacterium DAT-1]|nr:A24 family peptidase [Burkholderiaceae bacterium DAT-1]